MDIGVIGIGVMGRNHVRVYSELKRVESVHVFDQNRKVAEEAGARYGAIVHDSSESLLKETDAVSICVPTRFHAGTARSAFAAGCATLIEKPICTTVRQAEELLRAAPGGLTVGVGHIERFNPVVGEIRRIISAPLYMEMKRHNPASSRVKGTSVVEDLMIHDIDILQHVLFPGRIRLAGGVGNADIATVHLQCGKIPVSLSSSRKSSKKIRLIYIEEEEFTVEGDFMTQEVTLYRKPGQYRIEDERYVQENIIEKVMVNKLEPLRLELVTFLECARENRPFPVSLEQALSNLSICESIKAAL